MKVEVKGNDLVITLSIEKPFEHSKSGKSLTVASSRGITTTATQIEGKALKIGVNAFIER